MKKGLLVILFALFAMSNVKAQFSAGAGVTLFSGATGFEVRGNYAVNEQISIVPYFDYLSVSSVSLNMFGVDGHYSLGDPESFDYYPLLGLNIISAGGNSHTGFGAGGGLTYALSDSMKLFGELRYMSHGLASVTGISAGVLFSFN